MMPKMLYSCDHCNFVGSVDQFVYTYRDKGLCFDCRAKKREKCKSIYQDFLAKTQKK